MFRCELASTTLLPPRYLRGQPCEERLLVGRGPNGQLAGGAKPEPIGKHVSQAIAPAPAPAPAPSPQPPKMKKGLKELRDNVKKLRSDSGQLSKYSLWVGSIDCA